MFFPHDILIKYPSLGQAWYYIPIFILKKTNIFGGWLQLLATLVIAKN
jgi:hypothetical protein